MLFYTQIHQRSCSGIDVVLFELKSMHIDDKKVIKNLQYVKVHIKCQYY